MYIVYSTFIITSVSIPDMDMWKWLCFRKPTRISRSITGMLKGLRTLSTKCVDPMHLPLTSPTLYTWSRVKLQLYGAGGGHDRGGTGGYVEGIIDLSKIASKRFWVVLGGAGSTKNTTSQGVLYTTGGYNGGGRGVSNNTSGDNTGGGGGATDVRLNFTEVTDYDKAQRILVAGGGGGGTSNGLQGWKRWLS